MVIELNQRVSMCGGGLGRDDRFTLKYDTGRCEDDSGIIRDDFFDICSNQKLALLINFTFPLCVLYGNDLDHVTSWIEINNSALFDSSLHIQF